MDPRQLRSTPRLRGSTTRNVVLGLFALVALAGGLWWSLRTPPAAPASASAAPVAPARPAQDEAGPAGLERRASEAIQSVATESGLTIPVGVRLGGTGALAGRVLDRKSAAGVAGARVELHTLPPAGSKFFGTIMRLGSLVDEAGAVEPVAIEVSGDDGVFQFEGVRAGSYFVEARGSYHVPESPVLARVAPSGAGGPLEVWVRRGGRVLGIVELPDGSPAAKAGVSLRPGPEEILERARSGDLVLLDTQADADGAFVIHGVPEGSGWALAAYRKGMALSHVGNLTVRAGQDTRVVIRGRLGATLEGRLISAGGPEGVPVAGAPVPGAHVGVVPRGLRDLLFVEHLLAQCYDVSDETGRYVVRNVPPGEVDVVAWAPEHLPDVGPNLMLDEGGTQTAPDFVLESGPLVSGRVVDSAGDPIAGARVRWTPIDFQGFEFGFSFAPFLTQAIEGYVFPLTGADGTFVAGPFPGEPGWEITVRKAGFGEVSRTFMPERDEEPFEIVLLRGGSVEGIVMDGTERKPLTSFTVSSGAQIPLRLDSPDGDNPFSGGTLFEDPSGRFRFEPLESGGRQLTVTAPGYAPTLTEELYIVEGEVVRGVIVTMNPGGIVRGVVLDEHGGALGGALVYWSENQEWSRPEDMPRDRSRRPQTDQLPAGMREYAAALGVLGEVTTTSRPDGTFELVGVTPGEVIVYASHRELATGQSDRVWVEAGQPAEGVTIQLTKGATLFGRVTDRFDRPVPGVFVVAVAPSAMDDDQNGAGAAFYEGYSNEEGEYRIERMAGGGYFLTTARGDEALNPMSFLGSMNFEMVTVPAGEETRYDIVDTSIGGSRVTGILTDRGEPVSGGTLMAMGFESESLIGIDMKMARIREDGTFLFEALAPGEYQFQVGAMGGPRRRGGRGRTRMSVDIPDLPEVHLVLALPEGEVSGVVLDAVSGGPIERAQARLTALDAPKPGGLLGSMIAQGGGMNESEWTDEDGSFSFGGLEAGEYRLEVSSPRWGEQEGQYAPIEPITFVLRADDRLDNMEFRLQPAVMLSGSVVDEAGAPIAGARVLALRTDIESGANSRAGSGEDGRFQLKGLARGTWDLSVSAEGYASAGLKGLVIDDETPQEVELVLPLGIEVSVRVSDSAGRPVSGASAQLTRLEGSAAEQAGDAEQVFGRFFSGEGTTGVDGRYVLGRYAPGLYRLQVQRGFKRSAPQEVELEGEGSRELRATLP